MQGAPELREIPIFLDTEHAYFKYFKRNYVYIFKPFNLIFSNVHLQLINVQIQQDFRRCEIRPITFRFLVQSQFCANRNWCQN